MRDRSLVSVAEVARNATWVAMWVAIKPFNSAQHMGTLVVIRLFNSCATDGHLCVEAYIPMDVHVHIWCSGEGTVRPGGGIVRAGGRNCGGGVVGTVVGEWWDAVNRFCSRRGPTPQHMAEGWPPIRSAIAQHMGMLVAMKPFNTCATDDHLSMAAYMPIYGHAPN